MPELPDVERTRRDLKRWLVGAIVTAADTEDARLSRPTSPRAFARAVVGRTFERVERRGKWLRLDLDDGAKVFSHLGMTGDWVRVAIGAPTDVVFRQQADLQPIYCTPTTPRRSATTSTHASTLDRRYSVAGRPTTLLVSGHLAGRVLARRPPLGRPSVRQASLD